jgi:hypothetical protein
MCASLDPKPFDGLNSYSVFKISSFTGGCMVNMNIVLGITVFFFGFVHRPVL